MDELEGQYDMFVVIYPAINNSIVVNTSKQKR